MAKNDNCCNCAYLTPPWWVTMGFIPPANGMNPSYTLGNKVPSVGNVNATPSSDVNTMPDDTPPASTPPGTGGGTPTPKGDVVGIIKKGKEELDAFAKKLHETFDSLPF